MIRVSVIADAAAGKAYYRRGNDYHFEGQSHGATWHGKGADRLGLAGPVDYADFERLCDNLRPDTGTQLTARHAEARRVGYDFTFSVPKSVSVAYALGGDARIADEFRAAVADTMAMMEREMETRVRRDGAFDNRRTGNLIWCDFLHTTSRPIDGQPDPHLHVHAVAFNATFDREEGRWKAGEFARLKADAPYFQAAFRADLADRLQRLGYGVTVRKGDFEVTGVPDRVVKEFSRRTALIETTAVRLGVTDPTAKAKLGATTREKKGAGLAWPDLVERWDRRLTPEQRAAVVETVHAATDPRPVSDRSREAVTYALDHLTERQTVVSERRVVTEALRFGLGGVTAEGVYRELGRHRDVIRRVKDGVPLVTTRQALGWEKAVAAFAVRDRGRLVTLVGAGAPAPALDGLSPSQAKAVRHVWRSRDRITIVQGRAGTGKTTLTKTAVAGIERSGVPVQMLAPTAAASRGVLRQDGFADADTLAAFLNSHDRQERVRGGVIWLDECGLASVKDFAALCQLADRLEARLVVAGDPRQHKSVAAGDVFALLDRAGLPVAEVTEIKRQTEGKYKAVAELLAAGKVNPALGAMLRHGWVKEAGVVDDFLASLAQGKSALAVCPTHAEGERVTEQIRDRLKADGRVTDEREVRRLRPLNYTRAELREAKKRPPEEGVVLQRFAAYREDTQRLGVGDVIRATAPLKDSAGRAIDAGAVLRITGWTSGDRMTVTTASGAERVLAPDAGHLAAAYATTSHASQGRTCDHVYLWMPATTFPALSTAAAYVSGTRGREKVTLYTDHLDGLREAVQREDVRPTATELVRVNPKGVRARLQRHVAALRQLGREVHHRVLQPVVELTHANQKGNHR